MTDVEHSAARPLKAAKSPATKSPNRVKVAESTNFGMARLRLQPDLSDLEPAGGQKLSRMLQGSCGLAAGQHPGDLPLPVFALSLIHI